MKRSEVENAINWARKFLAESGLALPMFADWTPRDWAEKKDPAQAIIRTMRGWDVTTFGHDDFAKMGAVLFTIRNGLPDGSCGCPYAEKLILMKEGQVLPNHYHLQKTEDIINRGGGDLMVQVYNSTEDGKFSDTDVEIFSDGRHYTVAAGTILRIKPGESISIQCGMYHKFYAEGGKTLLGEVSKVNDDRTDNRFYEKTGRFPEIEEDEAPLYLLSNEYPNVK